MSLRFRGYLPSLVALMCFVLTQARAANPAAAPLPAYESVLSGLAFRSIGPAKQGGRIDSIAVVEQDPDTFYVGAATGGVWKTTNGGTTFQPIFDNLPALTVGDVAVAPSNPSVLWAGSGEPNNRQSSSWGSGVYKSTDSGQTWTHMGLDDTQAIGRIAIDPANPDVVYVAALGHLWGPNAERGLFRTTDGGKTWAKVLFIDNDTGVVDVALDPRSPNVVYAAAYERRRTPFGFNGGGPGSALYKSSDGGITWKKMTTGLPETGNLGRIGIAVYRKNPDILYTVIQGKGGGMFRSEDRGETWKRMSGAGIGSPYFSQVRVDPTNDLRVWGLLDFLMVSSDGGKTFTPDMRTGAHWDFHDLWIDPRNSQHMLAATDGGLYRSQDAGRSWEYLDTLPLGQVYRVGFDNATPYRICGGFQDNGVLCGPVRTRSPEGIANSDWQRVLTGDGFDVLIDPSDPDILYSESQDGNLTRLNLKSHEWFPIVPQPKTGEAPYRFNWEAPLLLSAHDPHTLYFAANFIFKSTDRGDTWTKLGGDLTTGVDRKTLPILGKKPSKDVVSLDYGVSSYPAITVVAESPIDANVLWAGTQDGNLQVSRDGGQTWTNVALNVPGVPRGTWVTSIAASVAAPGTAYAAFDGHRSDDFRIYIFRTEDFGRTWKSVSGGIPSGGIVRVVREDPDQSNLLFAGTEYGAYVSFDRGDSWSKLPNLPNVPVYDIAIQPREHDLILATHGRSFYVLDDLRPLEELKPQVLNASAHLFSVRPAIEWRLFLSSNGYNGDLYYTAPNPPYGALISYYLKSDVPGATVTIRDGSGALVQQIKVDGKAGLHRVHWDLRYTTANKPLDLQIWAAQQGFFIYHSLPNLGMPAPFVPPGEYTIELKAGTATASGKTEVADDPNVRITAADRQAHQRLTMEAFHLYEQGMDAQRAVLALEGALSSSRKEWKKNGVQLPEAADKAVQGFERQLDGVRAGIIGPKVRDPQKEYGPPAIWRMARLLYTLEAHTAAPTSEQRAQYTDLQRGFQDTSARLDQLSQQGLAELNAAMRAANLPYISLPGKNPTPEEKKDEDRD